MNPSTPARRTSMEPWGKAVVVFTLVGISSEVFVAGQLKEADKVHVEGRMPHYQHLERPIYTDSTSWTGHTDPWGQAHDRMTVRRLKDGRIQGIVVGSVAPVTLPQI
jgi:hypothetical protein